MMFSHLRGGAHRGRREHTQRDEDAADRVQAGEEANEWGPAIEDVALYFVAGKHNHMLGIRSSTPATPPPTCDFV